MRFFSCPPFAARHSLFQLPTPAIHGAALPAALSRTPASRRCPPRSSQPHVDNTWLPAPQLTSSTSAACRCPPRSSQPSLGYARRCPPRSSPAAPQLHVAARPAAHSSGLGYMSLPAPQFNSTTSAAQCCAPSSSEPRLGCIPATLRCPLSSQTCLGYTSLRALQLTAEPRLYDAARPATHQQHLSCMSLPAPRLIAAPAIHVAVRFLAHSRISAT